MNGHATSVLLVTDGVTNEGIIDPREFHTLLKKYDVRVFGFLMGNNANWPLIRFPVDHAFVSQHFGVEEFAVLRHVGSDHFPVYARLSLTPEAIAANETLQPADAGEEAEASEKISRAG